MAQWNVMWVSSLFVYHMSIPRITSMWLICPDLVLILIFVGLGLLSVVMIAGILPIVMQFGWTLHATFLLLTSSLYLMGAHISPLVINCCLLWFTCAPGSCVCDLSSLLYSTATVYIKMSSIHPVPFFISSNRYCSVMTGCCICASNSVLVICPFPSLWWWRTSLCGHCC